MYVLLSYHSFISNVRTKKTLPDVAEMSYKTKTGEKVTGETYEFLVYLWSCRNVRMSTTKQNSSVSTVTSSPVFVFVLPGTLVIILIVRAGFIHKISILHEKKAVLVTEVDKRVVYFELGSEPAPLYFGCLFIVVRDVSFLGRLGSPALRLKDNVEARTGRVDGAVLNTATVRLDLLGLVVRTIVHFYVVKRTTT